METIILENCEECGRAVPMLFAKRVYDRDMRPTMMMVCARCSTIHRE